MQYSIKINSIYLFIYITLAVLFSNPSMAVEIGKCLPADQMITNMQKEGQHSLIKANQATNGKIVARLFTSNDDGSVGYLLNADGAVDQPVSAFCVAATMSNVRIFDVRKQGLNTKALINYGNEKSIIENCAGKSSCNYHNTAIIAGEKNNVRPMLQADASFVNHQNDKFLVTVAGEFPARGGLMGITSGDGEMSGIGYSSTKFTDYALRLLERLPN